MRKIKVFLLTCIAMLLLSGCGGTKVDISEYVDVSFKGIDGRATASAVITFGDLEDLILGEDVNNIEMIYRIAELEKSVQCELSKEEGLSNGDSVSVTIKWSEDAAEKCGIKLTGSEKTFVVSGLQEGKVADLFSDIEIDYNGVSPEVSVVVRNISKDSYLSTINYMVEPSGNVANGDEIKVIANINAAAAEQKGYIVEETEKVYTVEGADEYISAYSEIDEETFNKMDAQSRDVIEAGLVNKYNYVDYMYPNGGVWSADFQEMVDIKLSRAYFFCLKDGLNTNSYGTVRNSIFLVYEVTAIDSKTPEGKTAYFPVYFKNFIMRNTGNLDVVITDARISYDTYETYDDLYREIVTANKDKYTFEEIIY